MSDTVLVDTDVFSYTIKNDTRAGLYRQHLDGRVIALSFMTVAELDQWALLHNWGRDRRARLEQRLRECLLLAYDRDLCRWWAEVRVARRRAGKPIELADAWIAATALVYRLPLVTHNPDDFREIPGLTVVSQATDR